MRKSTETSSFGSAGRRNHCSDRFYNSKLYNNIKPNIAIEQDNTFPPKYLNKILNSSSESMEEIPNNCVHLMITSPPYNVSKEYDKDLSLDEYLNLLTKVFKETYRVLVNGGRICVNVANIGRRPYIPLSAYIAEILIKIGFNLRGEIIWDKAASAGSSCAWGSWQSASNPVLRDVHEYIIIGSKGDYKRLKNNKSDTISRSQFMEYTKSIWHINAVSAKKIGHPAPFPEELSDRLIQLYSFKEDVILDPFMGSGTTAISALKAERYYIGYEINSHYLQLANDRIYNFYNEHNDIFKTKINL